MLKCRCGVALLLCALGPGAAAVSCQTSGGLPSNHGTTPSADAAAPTSQSFALNITAVDTRFVTRDHFIAAVEMQLSGEPFAESMGRALTGYSRDFSCQTSVCDPSLYHDPALNHGVAGGPNFATSRGLLERRRVVRVLEAADEQRGVRVGCRPALAFGPLVDPNGATGTDAQQALRDWVQHIAAGSNAATSASCTPTSRPDNPSDGRGSGRRCSRSVVGPRDRPDEQRVDGAARSAPTTIPAPPGRSTATTTSATTPRFTSPIARRR